MRQDDLYELLKERGPMTINQLVDIMCSHIKSYDRHTARSMVAVRLHQLEKWRMVESIGWTEHGKGMGGEGMRQSDVYELLKKHGPMTVNQLVNIAYPDTPDYQLTIRKVDINKRLNQLMMWDMVYICGKTDNLVGHKQNIWKTWE